MGATGGLQFNLVWDASVTGSAYASNIKQAAVAAATFYNTMFSNPEVVTIDVGFGELNGSAILSGNLAESASLGGHLNYAAVRAGLSTDAGSSAYQTQANSSLTSSDPTNGGSFFVTSAETKAFGRSSSASPDGFASLEFGVVGLEFRNDAGRLGSVRRRRRVRARNLGSHGADRLGRIDFRA